MKVRYSIPQIVQLMETARNETLKFVQNFSISCLDFNLDQSSASIGTLLMHIAALEKLYQSRLFLFKGFTETEYLFWRDALPDRMNLHTIKNNPVDYYFNLLSTIRQDTLRFISERDDTWLLLESSEGTTNADTLIHILFDEMNHLGQIKLLSKIYKETQSIVFI